MPQARDGAGACAVPSASADAARERAEEGVDARGMPEDEAGHEAKERIEDVPVLRDDEPGPRAVGLQFVGPRAAEGEAGVRDAHAVPLCGAALDDLVGDRITTRVGFPPCE